MRYLKRPNLEAGEWCDQRELILEATFQVLVDFMEKDAAVWFTDWHGSGPDAGAAWEEMISLYMWWKFSRPYRHDPYDLIEDYCLEEFEAHEWVQGNYYVGWDDPMWGYTCDEQRRLEGVRLEEDQRNLHRLIEARSYMWA